MRTEQTPRYYSQAGEDFVLDLLFDRRRKGFFVEVGCIDGRRYSNSLAFEERGWTGICVEAHRDYIEMLRQNRHHSRVFHCAAGRDDTGEVTFYANARGSLSTVDKSKEQEFRQLYGGFFTGFEPQTVRARSLTSVLAESGATQIDFISIDVEGCEADVVRGLDLRRFAPAVLVVECDGSRAEEEVDRLILPHGYHKSISVSRNRFYLWDKRWERRLRGRPWTIDVVHTRHPMDTGNDIVAAVTVNSECAGASRLQRLWWLMQSHYLQAARQGHPFRGALASTRALAAFVPGRSLLPPWTVHAKRLIEWKTKGSVAITDRATINAFLRQADNPVGVSFPRTGSHWLRMLIELYFGRPSLQRVFYFPWRTDYLMWHTHDLDLSLTRENVIYLYRDPVDTVYSQLSYYDEDLHDEAGIRHWADLYGQHLAKWLHEETCTSRKTVLRYDRLKADLPSEFAKVCRHFDQTLDRRRLDRAAARVSKQRLFEKIHNSDAKVVNVSDQYARRRTEFRDRQAKLVWGTVLDGRGYLRDAFEGLPRVEGSGETV